MQIRIVRIQSVNAFCRAQHEENAILINVDLDFEMCFYSNTRQKGYRNFIVCSNGFSTLSSFSGINLSSMGCSRLGSFFCRDLLCYSRYLGCLLSLQFGYFLCLFFSFFNSGDDKFLVSIFCICTGSGNVQPQVYFYRAFDRFKIEQMSS